MVKGYYEFVFVLCSPLPNDLRFNECGSSIILGYSLVGGIMVDLLKLCSGALDERFLIGLVGLPLDSLAGGGGTLLGLVGLSLERFLVGGRGGGTLGRLGLEAMCVHAWTGDIIWL